MYGRKGSYSNPNESRPLETDNENRKYTFYANITFQTKIHDQGDANWIVIRRSLWGNNNTPCGRPAPGWPISRQRSGHPQGAIGVF
jgi:hypothetical protein